CGNGQIDDGEVCDGVFLDEESCVTQGFEGGDLSCSSDCTAFVETDCHLCGNGQIDNDEVCDGEDFDTATCVSEGFEGGDLGCEADCSAVTTQSCSLGAGELCELYYAANPPPFKELACSFEPMPNYWDVAEDNIRDYYCSPGSEGWTWATAQLSAQNTGHMTIDWIQAKSCLEATRAFRADSAEYLRAEGSAEWKTIVDGVCADLAQGLLVENEACLGDWECAGELGCYTDTPTVADSLKCMPKVAAGGTYVPDFHLCDEKTSRPDGDSTTPTCVALFAEDESCSGVGTCLPGFRCDSGSAICLAELDLGDSCTQDDDCTALGACRACRIVTSGGTEVCALRALESEYCDADDECLDGLTCVENECIVAREGEYCDDSIDCAYGYECTDVCINYDNQTDCEVASECAWSGSACLTQVGGDICYKTPVIGDDCYGLGCENSYCDADTIVCTAYAAKGEACSTGNASGTTDPVCAPLSGALCTAGICVMSCYSDEQCVDGEYCSFIVTPAVCASVVTESCQEVTACGPAKYCSSSNTCVDKLALGEVCDARVVDASYRSQLCASGWCYDEDGDNSGLCTVEPLGLSDKNLGFLYSTFLFGFIFLGWRRRK
ncbi:hypothetical protein KAI87_14400, partial [Myxococcota bacterium]|nr:hypothetical protein [Myxococcota bacterium]